MSKPTNNQYRQKAREKYACDTFKHHQITIDIGAEISYADDGAWVAAWVWVPSKEVKGGADGPS